MTPIDEAIRERRARRGRAAGERIGEFAFELEIEFFEKTARGAQSHPTEKKTIVSGTEPRVAFVAELALHLDEAIDGQHRLPAGGLGDGQPAGAAQAEFAAELLILVLQGSHLRFECLQARREGVFVRANGGRQRQQAGQQRPAETAEGGRMAVRSVVYS